MVTKKVKLSFEVDVEVETDEFEEDFNDFENLMKNFALARLQVVERPDGSEEDSAYNEYVDGYIDLLGVVIIILPSGFNNLIALSMKANGSVRCSITSVRITISYNPEFSFEYSNRS